MDTKKKTDKQEKTDGQKEKKTADKKKKKTDRQKEKNRQTNKEQTVERDHSGIIFASFYTIIKKTKWVISFYRSKINAMAPK